MNASQKEPRFKKLADILDLEDEDLESVICLIRNDEIITLIQSDPAFKAAVMSVMTANANVVISRALAKVRSASPTALAEATAHVLSVANELDQKGELQLSGDQA